jgi:hypothetical protein
VAEAGVAVTAAVVADTVAAATAAVVVVAAAVDTVVDVAMAAETSGAAVNQQRLARSIPIRAERGVVIRPMG